MELPSGMLLVTTLIDPREPLSLAETFEQATLSPAAGFPRPTSIRVANDAMAKELRRVAGGIPIGVEPIPELDAAFAEMAEKTGGAAKASYLAGGVAEETVAEFFAAAGPFAASSLPRLSTATSTVATKPTMTPATMPKVTADGRLAREPFMSCVPQRCVGMLCGLRKRFWGSCFFLMATRRGRFSA